MPEEKMPDDWWFTTGFYGAVGIQFVAAVGGGMWLGSWCDRWLGTAPWLGAVGIILGTVGGFWNLYRIMQWKGRRQ